MGYMNNVLNQGQGVSSVKYCLYARKSSENEERQVLSIDSQIKEMLELATREGLEIVDVKRESHSAKDVGMRPVYNELIQDIKAGKFNGILTWAPDRISRNAGDLGAVVDLMDQRLLHQIRTHGQSFGNTPNEKFLLMILGSQAKLENDNRGINVKRGQRTRLEMGLRPNMAPIGYLNQKMSDKRCQIIPDPERAHVIKIMFEKVGNERWSGRKLFYHLRFDLDFKTRNNKHIALGTIHRVLSNTMYYGMIEFPIGSGNWYQGKHEPLITKELYDKVQEQLKRNDIKRQNKEFAFTKLMTCGLCGSTISAEEKHKMLKDGTAAKYIYYGCGRSKNLYCKNFYIREDELIDQLVHLLDKIDLNEFGIKMKFEEELKRFNKFQRGVLGQGASGAKHEDINLKTYAKYTLREGTNEERRELMGCFRSKIKMTHRIITIE